MTALKALSADEIAVLAGVIAKLRPHGAPRWDGAGVRAAFVKVADLAAADVLMAAVRLSQDRSATTPANIAKTNTECWRERVADWHPPTTRERCPAHQVQYDALGTCRACAADHLGADQPTPPLRSNAHSLHNADIASITSELRDRLAKHD